MTASVIKKTVYGLVTIGVVLLLAIASMGYLAFRLTEASHWTEHTHEVIEELLRSLSSLQDVETGNRGYAASGDRSFLEPCEKGKKDAIAHLDRVAQLTSDNPDQQKSVALARELSAQKVQFSDDVIKASVDEGRALIASAKGKKIMEAYRQRIAEMIDTESNLLEKRNRDLQLAQQLLWAGTLTLAVSALALLAWVFRITRTAIEDEKRRVAELNSLNRGLQAEIEQRKIVELALKDTTMKLTSSNTDLQQFAYVASHDLQEPLRAVAGFLTLIAKRHKGNLDPETEGWINHAVEGAQRMRALINDLLLYARVESRGKELEPTDCNKALEQAKKDLSVVLEETGAEIHATRLPTLVGDEGQLSQLFQNLVGNAIKFKQSDTTPKVDIEVRQENAEWIFSVKDNGIGFDQTHADRIFVIFQRLQGREEYQGTGIGLALCKKIVERHGGRIWAESSKGKGSTFFFTIPVMQGENDGGS